MGFGSMIRKAAKGAVTGDSGGSSGGGFRKFAPSNVSSGPPPVNAIRGKLRKQQMDDRIAYEEGGSQGDSEGRVDPIAVRARPLPMALAPSGNPKPKNNVYGSPIGKQLFNKQP